MAMATEHNGGWTLRNRPGGGDMGATLDWCAYLTVAVGYLYAILNAQQLTLFAFVVFTLLNVAWVGLFWTMTRGRCPARLEHPLVGGLVVTALGAQLMAWWGLGFDWLIPGVTVSILTFMLSRRVALIASTTMLLVTMATIIGPHLVTAGGLRQIAGEWLGALAVVPMYLFVVIFTMVLQRQQVLRERAEELAAELARSKADLEEANTELRRFSAQVEELAVTRERNRMAREIHDTLGHYLTILAVQLETSAKLWERGDPRLRAELVEARRVVAECLTEVRQSVAALRPADLTSTTFVESLNRLVGEYEAIAPHIEVTSDLEGACQNLSPELRMALYRCGQEALTNVRKHAHASKVLLRVRMENGMVELTVLDNGIGADERTAGPSAGGFGLLGMRERVALLGGTVLAGPEPERGWRVEVRVPSAASTLAAVSTPLAAAEAAGKPEGTWGGVSVATAAVAGVEMGGHGQQFTT